MGAVVYSRFLDGRRRRVGSRQSAVGARCLLLSAFCLLLLRVEDVLERIDRPVAAPDLIVKVRSRGPARRPDEADVLPARDLLPGLDEDLLEVAVNRPIAALVGNLDHV